MLDIFLLAELLIERAPHTENVFLCYMRVDHGGLQEFVAEQLLNRPDVITLFKQMGGKTMSQYMNRGLFCDPSLMHRIFKFLLE